MEDEKQVTKPFSINGKTYKLNNISDKVLDKMQEWLRLFETKKQKFQSEHPTLSKEDYYNMSFIWLIGELVEYQNANLNLIKEQENIKESLGIINENVSKNLNTDISDENSPSEGK